MIKNNFLVDVIYNHKYLEKVIGLLKSLKKYNIIDEILEVCDREGVEEDDEVLHVFRNEIRNIIKCNDKDNTELFENLNETSSSQVSEDLIVESVSDDSCENKNKNIRIYADGVFDLVHYGHFNAILQAKKLGDILVVGINSDEDVFKSKGCKPIYTEEERAELMRGCKWIDEVIVGTKYHVDIALLEKYNCDYAAHGNDIACDSNGNYCYEEVKKHNRLKIFERSYGISTTSLINHLLQAVEKGCNHTKLFDSPKKEIKNEKEVKDEIINNKGTSPNKNTAIINSDTSICNNYNNNNNNNSELSGYKDIKLNQMKDIEKEIKKKNKEGIHEEPPENLHRISENFKNMKNNLNRNKNYITASRLFQFSSYNEKKKRKRVVYVDGSFDIFHVGHLRILQKAKTMGDYLLVGIHDDEVVRKMKGDYFPVVSLLERTLCVLAMKVVDDVIIGAPWIITEHFIKVFNIDTVVRGTKVDYIYLNNEIDPYMIPKALNIYKEIESEWNITTFEIIQRIEKNKIHLKDCLTRRRKNEDNIWKNSCPPTQFLSKLK